MERTPLTLRFRYHPRFSVGSTVSNQTVHTSGLPVTLKGSYLVVSLVFHPTLKDNPGAFTAILEPMPAKP